MLQESVSETRSKVMSTDVPLAEVGFDSLLSVELRNALGKEFSTEFPASLLYDFPSCTALISHVEGRFSQKKQSKKAQKAPRKVKLVEKDDVEARIFSRIQQISGLGARDVHPEVPLAEIGFDSLLSVELRNALGKEFQTEFPASLLFDFPTPARLTNHIASLVGGGVHDDDEHGQGDEVMGVEVRGYAEVTCTYIVGVAVRAGPARTRSSLWKLFDQGFDNASLIPATRFDWSRVYNVDFTVPGACNSKWGSFMEGISEFDAAFFAFHRVKPYVWIHSTVCYFSARGKR